MQNREDRIVEEYRQRADNFENEANWIKDDELLTNILTSPFGDGELVDICSGTGVVARKSQELGWVATSIDISLRMLKQAAEKGLPSIVGVAESVPLKRNSADLVTCRQGLHYTEIPTALQEFQRVSRDSVHLAHITLEEEADRERWQEYFDIVNPKRQRIFAPGEIPAYCRDAGFEIERTDTYQTRAMLSKRLMNVPEDVFDEVVTLFTTASERWQENYNVSQRSGTDLSYSQRWEITRLKTSD